MKYLTIVFLIVSFACFSQTDNKKGTIKVKKVQVESTEEVVVPGNDNAFSIIDQMPSYPGGNAAMQAFVLENLHYPEAEKEAGISGTVYVSFVVEPDGSITNVTILRGVSGGPGCDKEALRVIKMMPKWLPGKQGGKVVRSQICVPIKFGLK